MENGKWKMCSDIARVASPTDKSAGLRLPIFHFPFSIFHRPHPRRRGTEIIELALLLPILLLLSFGTVEFGYFFYLNHTAAGAAREGARARIPSGATDEEAEAAVDTIMATVGLQAGDDYDTDISVDPDTRVVTVTVTCANWETIGVRPMGMISGTRQITGVAVMRAESN